MDSSRMARRLRIGLVLAVLTLSLRPALAAPGDAGGPRRGWIAGCLHAITSFWTPPPLTRVPGLADLELEQALAQSPSENFRRYVRFCDLSNGIYRDLGPALREELAAFGTLSGREQGTRLGRLAADVESALVRRFGVRRIGLHYNMHGGTGVGYVRAGGIRATYGDIMLSMGDGMTGIQGPDPRRILDPTVFYYDSTRTSLAAELLGFGRGSTTRSYAGTFIILFDIDAVERTGRTAPYGGLSGSAFSFPRRHLAADGVGVPVSTFLLPPIQYNTDVWRRLELPSRLSARQSSWAALRHLQALLAHPDLDSCRLR